jgi:hypothetical protein
MKMHAIFVLISLVSQHSNLVYIVKYNDFYFQTQKSSPNPKTFLFSIMILQLFQADCPIGAATGDWRRERNS